MVMWAATALCSGRGPADDPTQPIPDYISLRRPPNGSLEGPSAVAFDSYPGAPSASDIVFQADGTLVAPASSNSRAQAPSTITASAARID
jgi:hypothetical protein